MKLELAEKIVAHDRVIKETERVIKYFEEPGEIPRVKIEFDVPQTLNYLVAELDFDRQKLDKEMHGMLVDKLRERLEDLKVRMMELEDE